MASTKQSYLSSGFYADGDCEISGDLIVAKNFTFPSFKGGTVAIPNNATSIDIQLSETTGSAIMQIHCETDDDAVAMFSCVKASESNAGSVNRIDYQNGTISTKNIMSVWTTGANKISVNYNVSWNGGIGSTTAHYSLFMDSKI